MKNIYVIIAVALIFFMLLLPLLSLKSGGAQDAVNKGSNGTVIGDNTPIVGKADEFRVLNSETGAVETVLRGDYIFGVVAAEMPALYNDEALKAQAVAAYTYALFRKSENTDKNYDITDSPSTDQRYITVAAAREKWGENADLYESKIKNAVACVEGEYISYGGAPILALYHAISGGRTESCLSVFGQDLLYLTERDSIGDLLNSDYQSTVTVSPQELSDKLRGTAELTGDAGGWISEVKHRDNGYVESVTICGKSLSGTEMRNIFSLRSANFNVAFNGDFCFTVRGYGHGVGLSQSGAQYMAEQGGTYKEILLWYYNGCEIVKEN